MDNSDKSVADTLPDDAWKDTFDKLLDERKVLRELNIIKKNVHASYNMNSSCGNSSCDNSKSSIVMPTSQLGTSPITKLSIKSFKVPPPFEAQAVSKSMSTPVRKHLASTPFSCDLSPIMAWNFRFLRTPKVQRTQSEFNATKNSRIIPLADHQSAKKSAEESNEVPLLLLIKKPSKPKQGQRQVCFDTNNQEHLPPTTRLTVQSGKWRRSLYYLRRTLGDCDLVDHSIKPSKRLTFIGERKSIALHLENAVKVKAPSRRTRSLSQENYRRQVLEICRQRKVLSFEKAYNEEYLAKCQKIGDGAFGEVFLYTSAGNNADAIVMKIIPIEGKEVINGEIQKTIEQILPEVIIAKELSALAKNRSVRKPNMTKGFVNLYRARYVQGEYPETFVKLWEDYDDVKSSENDNPKCFSDTQKYIILELGFSGTDLESFTFRNAEQTYYALQQIILTLAVAEEAYQFEHRDLHWGNVLVLNTEEKYISYKLADKELILPTKGVYITIIDFTLSRITYNNCCLYNDLSNDEELFTATGDYQFDIYRMMRKILNDQWEKFEPKTNVFWISYIIKKFICGVSYKNDSSKIHSQHIRKLEEFDESILTHSSCVDCVSQLLKL
ncbi:putative serine/threonine-protein kinase haspin homolog isoform X1 [Glossina fuscipes]|uniref:non-specific serine/threonine protein kinase n=1 Tax=Glossina fuscipes TaxID=7396 RepID=A0A9C5ZB16_9MUSC|nr:putative serine/threonine-protein kinase haspin homolog isoform X1 [Glossina fuscipes]